MVRLLGHDLASTAFSLGRDEGDYINVRSLGPMVDKEAMLSDERGFDATRS